MKTVKIETKEDDIINVGRFIFNFEENQIKRSVPYIYQFEILKLVNKLTENSTEKLQIS